MTTGLAEVDLGFLGTLAPEVRAKTEQWRDLLLGVTKPVSLKLVSFPCGENPFNKKPMCGGDATATIKRSEWGMTAGIPNSPADEVTLRLPFEGYRE